MTALLLHLHGPMQSWGGPARFSQRPTSGHPTKSAVVGILAASQGRPRGSDVTDLAALRMTVRVDRPGRLMRDYHTVGAEHPKGRRLLNAEGKEKADALVTERYYLADAAFTIALDGDAALVERLEAALRAPRWALALGRRSCPPAEPFLLGLHHGDPVSFLEKELPVARPRPGSDRTVHFSTDDPAGTLSAMPDQPTGALNRWADYRARTVRTWAAEMTPERFADSPFALADTMGST